MEWTPVEQTATGPDGKKMALVGGQWIPASQTATGPDGKKMALFEATPTAPDVTAPAEVSGGVGADIATAVAPTIRGASPYAAGALAGAALGAPLGGVGAVPGALAGAGAVGLVDLGLSAYNPIARFVGLPQAPTIKEITDQALTKLGLPQSQGAGGRVIEAMAGGAGGAASFAKAAGQQAAQMAPGAAQKVIEQLSRNPGLQTVSGATSGLAAQTTAEMTDSVPARILASIFGGLIPGLASKAPGAIVRGSSTPAEIQARVDAARSINIKPDLAYAAPSVISKMANKAVAGTETMIDYRNQVQRDLSREANRVAKTVGEATNPNMAGRLLERELGPDGFLQRAKGVEDTLWTKWWGTATAPGKDGMRVDSTLAYLKGSQKGTPGYDAISELTKDKKLASVLQHFESDLAGTEATPAQTVQTGVLDQFGRPVTKVVTPATPAQPPRETVPYEAVKELRTIIGEKLDPQNMSPDVSRKALKGLYGALTRDIEAHAEQLGPEAQKEFNRANNYTRALHDRVDTYLQEVQGKKPYQVWRYATSPDSVSNGGHQFLTINRSLTPGARETFHSTFIRNMGANPQGEFDPSLFVDKYRSLAPGVKSALLPGEKKAAVDRMVGIIDGMKKAGSIGPTDQSSFMGAYMIMAALLHAHPKAILTAAFASSKSERLAKILTDPTVIDHVSGVNGIPKTEAATAIQAYVNAIHAKNPRSEYDQ